MKKRKRKSNKGNLIRAYVENVSQNIFDVARNELKRHLDGESGLYALYKNGDLYYVGMSKNLFSRLHKHTTDDHKNRWDNFSAYVIRRDRYIKDLEAVILRLDKKKGNKQLGHFPRGFNLKSKLKPVLKSLRRTIERLFHR